MDVEALLKSGDINSIRAYAVDLNNKGVATEDKELKRKLFVYLFRMCKFVNFFTAAAAI